MRNLILVMLKIIITCTPLLSFALSIQDSKDRTVFLVGAGIYDITGPAAEVGMMGYGMLNQRTAGILQRLWSRAFVIESLENGKRVAFVNVDLTFVTQGVKIKVIEMLRKKYGNQYDFDNVLITATHTHSVPGGYSTHAFYNITTLGFIRQNFNTIIDGIVKSIERAENNMKPAYIRIAAGDITDISHNRSPNAYLNNPAKERAQYTTITDNGMTLIRFDGVDGSEIGLINWFPIHGVSLNNKNELIAGDNKGYAEYLYEKDYHSNYGEHDFVAAFAQSNAGDVTPNRYGQEGGEGLKGIAKVEKAGLPQYEKAKELYQKAREYLVGDVDYRHEFVDMRKLIVDPIFTQNKARKTCASAIGISMLAGTKDGEGVGEQGITCDNINKNFPFFCCKKNPRSICHGEKPVILATGSFKPYPWTPNIIPYQVIKIGNLVILGEPFEMSTMAGRRLKSTVEKLMPRSHHLALSTISNVYAGYVTTNEEYQLQRYEGASTLFGPWQEAAVRQEFSKLTNAMFHHTFIPKGPIPEDLSDTQIELQTSVLFDSAPMGKKFGSINKDVKKFYKAGEIVSAEFWAGHPKNNLRLQGTYLAIEQLIDGTWHRIRTDRDWDTEYHWKRYCFASSLVTIVWRTPKNLSPGFYRIVHYGDAKLFCKNAYLPYTGYSKTFSIV